MDNRGDAYSHLLGLSDKEKSVTQKLFSNWKKKKPKQIDDLFHKAHVQAFKNIDCLNCANCCKTTSPIFRDVDIKRIAKRLRLTEAQLESDLLRTDEDGDKVLKSSPCYFLGSYNQCAIYEDRPLACREYPHTDRKKMYQILDLTLKNTEICPAVAEVVREVVKTS